MLPKSLFQSSGMRWGGGVWDVEVFLTRGCWLPSGGAACIFMTAIFCGTSFFVVAAAMLWSV